MAQRPQNSIEYRIQVPGHVLGQKAEHQIAVLLEQLVLAPVASVGQRIRQMLWTIDFNDESRRRAQQIDFHARKTVECDC